MSRKDIGKTYGRLAA